MKSFHKKAGFGEIIGSMLAFFAITGLFYGSFFIYQDQIETQEDYLSSFSDGEIYEELVSSFSLGSASLSSGRLDITLLNDAPINLNIGEQLISCFDIFKNGRYVNVEDFYIYPKEFPLSGEYKIIEPNEEAILTILNVNDGDEVKIVSCTGTQRIYSVSSSELNWYDLNLEEKFDLTVTGSNFSHAYDYQIKLNLSSSQLSFNKIEENEIRFISPYSDFLVLDLSFDDYTQSLIDNSQFAFGATLGATSGVSGDDPQEFENGIILSSLDFESSDLVRVSSFDALDNVSDFTISFWSNLDLLSTGQEVFNLGNIIEIELGDSSIADSSAIRFELNNNVNRSSNTGVLNQQEWQHIVLKFSQGESCLYVNSVETNCFTNTFNELNLSSGILDIGSSLNGKLDELKIYGYALSNTEIINLYNGNLRFKELDFFTQHLDLINQEADFWIKVPFIPQDRNVSISMFYDSDNTNTYMDFSSIRNTFSYNTSRTFAYVLDERQSSSQGLSIISLQDNNDIFVGTNSLTLNDKQTSSLASGLLNLGDEIRSTGLVHLDGDATGGEMVTPISWASDEFHYRGFRNAGDRFCMISPFGDSNVTLRENGVQFSNIIVDSTVTCISQDIGTANVLSIESSIPILVTYYGATGDQDPFVFYPATSKDLYGSPSQTLYLAAGSAGASGSIDESSGASNGLSLGAYGTINDGGNGGDGNAPAFRVVSDERIGAMQQADGDGSESTVFVPIDEFSTYFGVDHAASYISVVSNVENANCSVYDSSDVLVENVPTGTGVTDIYKYDFGVGNDVLYVNGPWTLTCDQPVWPYIENTEFDDDEMNILGYKQMRQYIYPEPQITLQ